MTRWCGDGMLQLAGYSEIETNHDEVEQAVPATLAHRIQACLDNLRWAVEKFAVSDGGIMLANAIHQGQAVVVSDGSFKDSLGTAAYMLEGTNSDNHIVVVLVTPGMVDDPSPY
jgi:hypothetical protein